MVKLVVELPEPLFVAAEAAVAAGEHASVQELVQEAVANWEWERRLYEPEVVERLRAMIRESEDSGPSTEWNVGEFLQEARARFANRR